MTFSQDTVTEHINSLIKARRNLARKLLSSTRKRRRQLLQQRITKLIRRTLLQLQIQQHHRRQQILVELGLGIDQRGDGRVDIRDKRDDRQPDGDGFEIGQVGRGLRRLGPVVDGAEEACGLDCDGNRAEDVAVPGGNGRAELCGGVLDAYDGVGDGLAVGEDGSACAQEEEGGEEVFVGEHGGGGGGRIAEIIQRFVVYTAA